jgi:hypothetical protein
LFYAREDTLIEEVAKRPRGVTEWKQEWQKRLRVSDLRFFIRGVTKSQIFFDFMRKKLLTRCGGQARNSDNANVAKKGANVCRKSIGEV